MNKMPCVCLKDFFFFSREFLRIGEKGTGTWGLAVHLSEGRRARCQTLHLCPEDREGKHAGILLERFACHQWSVLSLSANKGKRSPPPFTKATPLADVREKNLGGMNSHRSPKIPYSYSSPLSYASWNFFLQHDASVSLVPSLPLQAGRGDKDGAEESWSLPHSIISAVLQPCELQERYVFSPKTPKMALQMMHKYSFVRYSENRRKLTRSENALTMLVNLQNTGQWKMWVPQQRSARDVF